MTFKARIAISAAAAVALTVVGASILLYLVAREQLRAPVDEALETRAAQISLQPLGVLPGQGGRTYLAIRPEFGEARGYVQLVKTDGTVLVPPRQELEIPVGDNVLDLAHGHGAAFWEDLTVDGTHLRVFTFAYGPGAAVQVARPLTEVETSLDRIGLFLILIALGGIVVAALLGLLVARAALTPVKRLTETVERVSETQDLSERIDVTGNDELSRLAASFNSMFAALEESTRAQRQLVADASHELRTPLTSVRTNIEVLAGDRTLPPEDRTRLLSDVVEQLGEMTTLISELIELARAEQQTVEPEDVRLDLLVADAVERAAGTDRGSSIPSSSSRRLSRVSLPRSSALSEISSTTRRSGTRREPRSRSRYARERSPFVITARGSPTRIFRTSSIASIGRGLRAGCRDPVSVSRSFVRLQSHTAAMSSPSAPKAVGLAWC